MGKSSKEKRAYVRRSPRERFLRDATFKTVRILKSLQDLKGCANRKRYEYSDEQLSEMFDAITHELAATRDAFNNGHEFMEEEVFSFSGSSVMGVEG